MTEGTRTRGIGSAMALGLALAAMLGGVREAHAAPADTLMIDGRAVTARPLDVITTRSGRWQFDGLGDFGDIAAYRWRHEGSDHTRIMLCRAPLTQGEAKQELVLTRLDVRIGSMRATAAVAPGACRIVEDGPLVEPRAEWIVAAVRDGRLPAYSRTRSWVKTDTPPIERAAAYDPGEIPPGRRGGVSANHNNFVGIVSGQGGEYPASRGFLHDIDARAVDLALAGERIGDWRTLERYTWESLSFPQGAVWSARNHVSADPQFPFPGDKHWAFPYGGDKPADDLESLLTIKGWTRDPAHLENTCYIHWLATEDPVAGLCVQRQLAYALGHYPRFLRARDPAHYGGNKSQERTIYNTLSALWKARDVATHVRSGNGRVLWNGTRIDRMKAEVFAMYDPVLAPAPGGDAWSEARRTAASLTPIPERMGYFSRTGGETLAVTTQSNFQLVQYGKEPLYLWARAGDPRARKWLTIAARQIAARVELVGGAKGIDQCAPLKSPPEGPGSGKPDPAAGSSIPVGPTLTQEAGKFRPAAPPWTGLQGWATWLNGICPPGPSDRYDGAAIHTATEAEGLLLLARAAGVPGLDSAIERVTRDRKRTQALRYVNLNMAKHWAAPWPLPKRAD